MEHCHFCNTHIYTLNAAAATSAAVPSDPQSCSQCSIMIGMMVAQIRTLGKARVPKNATGNALFECACDIYRAEVQAKRLVHVLLAQQDDNEQQQQLCAQ